MIKNCYVYLITESYTKHLRGLCAVKIGLAVSPERRVRELQTGNARRLQLFMTIGPMSDKRAVCIERRLHKRFKKIRLVGEWFEPQVITMMQVDFKGLDYEGEVEIYSPLIVNKDEQTEKRAQQDLDRKCIANAAHRI